MNSIAGRHFNLESRDSILTAMSLTFVTYKIFFTITKAYFP